MSCITEINKRDMLIERVRESVDWLSCPVRISIDEREIHVALSVSVGDPAHYGECHTSEPEDRPVAEFISQLAPHSTSMSVTFKKSNVINEVRVESRDDCLVIHNAKGDLSLSVCTLMEVLEVDRSVASRAFRRIAQKQVGQICLTCPREEWMLSQNRA